MANVRTLKNGTRVHIVPMPGTQAMTALVLYKVGSRNEPHKVWGGSHFIEHLMFKGTKKRPTTLELTQLIDQYGAEYNAYTGKDLTGYYIKIDGEKAAVAIDVLGDMLQNSLFDKKEMDKERKVIIEEIKMYEENPIMHVEDLLEDAMFDGHALGKNIAGTPVSMMAMKRADVLAYRDAYYVPSNTVIVLSGKVPKDAVALLEKAFGKARGKKVPEPGAAFAGVTPSKKPRIGRQYKPLQQVQLAFGFPTVGRAHPDQEAIKLMATILGGSMSSRLFIEVREKRGLCYTVKAAADAYDDAGIFMVRAGLDAKRIGLACDVILKEIKKMAAKGVTDDELKKAKDHVEGALKLRLEDSSDRAEFVGRQELFFGDVESLDARLAKFAKVTRADIARVAKAVFDFPKMAVATVGPFKSDAAVLEHIKV
ncbi:insulinase family protein [Candidatus Uhrbacteria bacterium]|nr:insulinase family protein [Candidatus Uhrbacteria bacterium]